MYLSTRVPVHHSPTIIVEKSLKKNSPTTLFHNSLTTFTECRRQKTFEIVYCDSRACVASCHTAAACKTLLLHNYRIVLFIWVFNRLTSRHDPWGIVGIIIHVSVLPIKYEMTQGMAPHISSALSLKIVGKNESLKQKWIFCIYHKPLTTKQQPSDSCGKEAFSIILEFARIFSDRWRWTFRPTKVRWLPFHCKWTHMQFCRPSNWCSHAKQRTHGKTRSKETKDSTVLIARCLKAIPANGCVGNVLEMWTFLTRSWVISLPISLLSNRSRHFLLTSYNAKILF